MIISNVPQRFSYPLENEACFIHVKQGHHIAFTPDEIVKIPEGNLAFANSGTAVVRREGELTAETLEKLGCEWLDNRKGLQQMTAILDAQSQQDASQTTAQLIRDTLGQK